MVPLRDLLTLTPGDLVVQIGGNLLAFAAAGFLLPARWPLGIGTVVVVAAGASTELESPQ